MIQSRVATWAQLFPEMGDGEGDGSDVSFSKRAGPRFVNLNRPTGLVVSSYEEVLRKLARIMGQCGLATLLASSVAESVRILDRENVRLVLCYDRLIDGDYEDILRASERSRAKASVIVFSSTGDWSDYFRAIGAGAFDYVAYPPFLGELPRVIRNALASRMASTVEESPNKILKSSQGEMP
jgi:DNA-binding NtrC family response regulator